MRVVWTLIWSFLLSQMMAYVISSMTGTTYDFMQATIMSVVIAVGVMLVAAVIPNEPVEHH
ncbi:YjzD family protein [Bacillus sp. 165]|uniref:YjzD family protein n=1 Tax=Bacillus sp. 165 TaxID=1529117 RepID=UPI001ADAE236|nr:YjzD family protein [Bacillus sp. 165]MBO9128663.1 YjzD family protein [Bacillus sp. 165]